MMSSRVGALILTFLGAKDAAEAKNNVNKLSILVPSVAAGQWLLILVTTTVVAFMKKNGVSPYIIFLILWGGNMMFGWLVVRINDATKTDVTMVEGVRRLIKGFREKRGATVWVFLEIIIICRLLIWDGPDRFILFTRDNFKTKAMIIIVFVLASGFQMAAWSLVYMAGYDGLSDLLIRANK